MIKNIDGFPGYAITEDAKVYHNGKEIKPSVQPNGYVKVYSYRDDKSFVRYLHRLVAEAFIPNPDYLLEVNHKDKIKSNCASFNLEWCTRQYNMEHAKARAVQQLNKEGILLQTFVSLSEAARYMNKPKQTGNLQKVCNGERQTWLGYKWRYENEAVD